jgi:hypothetical protein
MRAVQFPDYCHRPPVVRKETPRVKTGKKIKMPNQGYHKYDLLDLRKQ